MRSRILELFGLSTLAAKVDWTGVTTDQQCPFVRRKCFKVRKSDPGVSIGTCSVAHGKSDGPVIICPLRLLDRNQIFTDCLHLLTSHEPGNQIHVVNEIALPGGSVDYFLVSVRDRRVRDFVGIEFQTMDTTGTVWPERQRFLLSNGVSVLRSDAESKKLYGMNWKMTAKTTLVQLHHKIQTFEHVNKRLVLVIQDRLMEYMRSEFSFDHLVDARLGDAMHFHAYSLLLQPERGMYSLGLSKRLSTDGAGVARCLGLKANANVELADIVAQIEAKISDESLLTFEAPPPPSSVLKT
jgi:hypothetical protein